MKVSLITAVYNRQATIASAIRSVAEQDYNDLEYIVVDGMSSDGTDAVVASHSDVVTKSIREPDGGIYDALNKGISASSGDVVGFLHADDLLATPKALSAVAAMFDSGNFDAVYADLFYVDAANPDRVVRYWKSGSYNVGKFRRGWMPPHPTVYVRREIYNQFGMYRTDHGSAADYECMVRLMVAHGIRVGYLPQVTVKMRVGGESNASVANRIAANRADQLAWTLNAMKPPWGLRFTKPLRKLPQYWRKPEA
ncbi:PGL/p-HBAD biosynthesis glycosyltransferase [Planctomycetes bacterium CA13]|uniref:PGL/p-HBAD biosynthesis glycosyltransferase n=1 Tax=Novipirellula herctigrandis TaxID=2527986 RepID=A0A5C5Z974_9BACT|nr:PGL/p-HBAD biosynthesis glycosyltransferase [Planctomycetes bacterium CA13]